MDYKFTFEDGSEALIHYGVKGQHWGVRKKGDKAAEGPSSSNGKTSSKKRIKNSKKVKESGKKFKSKDAGKFGARMKRKQLNVRSSSRLGRKTAAKYAQANSNYDMIKRQRKNDKLYGY